jgi:hypothetical protein
MAVLPTLQLLVLRKFWWVRRFQFFSLQLKVNGRLTHPTTTGFEEILVGKTVPVFPITIKS